MDDEDGVVARACRVARRLCAVGARDRAVVDSDGVEVMSIAVEKFPLRRGLDGCGTIHHEVRLWLAPVALMLAGVCL